MAAGRVEALLQKWLGSNKEVAHLHLWGALDGKGSALGQLWGTTESPDVVMWSLGGKILIGETECCTRMSEELHGLSEEAAGPGLATFSSSLTSHPTPSSALPSQGILWTINPLCLHSHVKALLSTEHLPGSRLWASQ